MNATRAAVQETSMEVDLTVIIPVYNSEQYIEACLDSLCSQGQGSLEILCIDDGSTDTSVDIIRRRATTDSRIRLVSLPHNMGAPVARNAGIVQSRGRYLLFMDADDLLYTGSLFHLLRLAMDMNSDATKGTMFVLNEDGKSTPHYLNQARQYLHTTLDNCPSIQHMYQYQSYLFRGSLVRENALRFNPGLKNFQDPVFMAHLLPKCMRIDVTLYPLYIRRKVQGSIINSEWSYANYLSLVNGTNEAYVSLLEQGQLDAAHSIAMTFSNWWHKFEIMPTMLTCDECMDILSRIKAFSDQWGEPLCRPQLGGMHRFQCLRMISQGKLAAVYQCLGTGPKLARSRRLQKVVDIPAYAIGKLREQVCRVHD